MLTGRLVRVRFHRDRIVPAYLDVGSPEALEWAEQLLTLIRNSQGRTRGEIEEDIEELIEGSPDAVVPQGLAKLLEDRSEFEVQTSVPPEELRDAVFRE